MKEKLSQSSNRVLKNEFFLIIILSFVFKVGFSQTNIISNGGFENGTIGWTVWGASLSTSTDSHSGSLSALVSNRKNSWDAVVQDITSKLVNGGKYTLSEWVKIISPSINFRATIVFNIDGVNTYKFFFLDSKSRYWLICIL